MAVIQPSILFESIRGSIGSITFSQGRVGLIAKSKVVGRKNYTNKQANVIKIQSYITGQWQNLSLANQLLWNDYALLYEQIDRFGVTKNISGFNWFAHMNNLKFPFDGVILDAPPIRVSAEIPTTFIVDNNSTSLGVIFDAPINYAENLLYIFATRPNQLTSSKNRGKLRLIKVIESPDLTEIDLTADYESYFDVVWSELTNNGNFKIQVCMYTVNVVSWMNSVQLCGNGELTAFSANARITEDLELRITEDDNTRVVQ